jgi:hypothetical protein
MQQSLLPIFKVGGQIMSFVVRRSMCAEHIVAPFSASCDIIDVSARLVSFDLGRQLQTCWYSFLLASYLRYLACTGRDTGSQQ